MDSEYIFFGIVALMAIQRLFELRTSIKNERWILSQGGHEVGHSHYKWMVALHSSWMVAMIAEVYFLSCPFILPLALLSLFGAVAGQILRYVAITTLGKRWTTKIFILPQKEAVSSGIFKYLKHPNYLGVILEVFFVPLIHTAFLTSAIYSALNGLLLKKRIHLEEQALSQSNNYGDLMKNKSRFMPQLDGSNS